MKSSAENLRDSIINSRFFERQTQPCVHMSHFLYSHKPCRLSSAAVKQPTHCYWGKCMAGGDDSDRVPTHVDDGRGDSAFTPLWNKRLVTDGLSFILVRAYTTMIPNCCVCELKTQRGKQRFCCKEPSSCLLPQVAFASVLATVDKWGLSPLQPLRNRLFFATDANRQNILLACHVPPDRRPCMYAQHVPATSFR